MFISRTTREERVTIETALDSAFLKIDQAELLIDDVVDEFLHIDVADKHACRHHQKGDAHYDNLQAVIF